MTSGNGTDMRPADLGPLRALAARIGSEPSLVQGPGGNVSIKENGILWIKASGTWLMQALAQDILVPVDLEPLLAALHRGDPACETCVAFVRQDLNPEALRPSIETTLHAALRRRVVVHVHCVETIAWAVETEAEVRLAEKLRDFDWAFLPYMRPGVPLGRAIIELRRPDLSVLILGNHGLVVAADSVPAAEALLADVCSKLRRPVRAVPEPQYACLRELAEHSAYIATEGPALHGIALDPQNLAIASAGSLYPDHVIFLGPGAAVVQPGETIAATLDRVGAAPRLLLVPGAGVLVHRQASPAAHALIGCLADVCARLRPSSSIHYLSPVDEAALLDWDAEKYRQAMDSQP